MFCCASFHHLLFDPTIDLTNNTLNSHQSDLIHHSQVTSLRIEFYANLNYEISKIERLLLGLSFYVLNSSLPYFPFDIFGHASNPSFLLNLTLHFICIYSTLMGTLLGRENWIFLAYLFLPSTCLRIIKLTLLFRILSIWFTNDVCQEEHIFLRHHCRVDISELPM